MDAANSFRIQVTDAFLTVHKLNVSHDIQLGHTHALMKGPAKFYIKRKGCRILAIPDGFQSFVKGNILSGLLPKRFVVGMVYNEGFARAVGRNPYNFEHFNANYMQLCTDG